MFRDGSIIPWIGESMIFRRGSKEVPMFALASRHVLRSAARRDATAVEEGNRGGKGTNERKKQLFESISAAGPRRRRQNKGLGDIVSTRI